MAILVFSLTDNRRVETSVLVLKLCFQETEISLSRDLHQGHPAANLPVLMD